MFFFFTFLFSKILFDRRISFKQDTERTPEPLIRSPLHASTVELIHIVFCVSILSRACRLVCLHGFHSQWITLNLRAEELNSEFQNQTFNKTVAYQISACLFGRVGMKAEAERGTKRKGLRK